MRQMQPLPTKPRTILEKRAYAACQQIKEYSSWDFSVEWIKSRTWGYCPRVMWHGEKAAYASGCGYDKLSAVLVELLTWLVPDDTLRGCAGAGVRSVQDALLKAGWRLEHTFNGRWEDGFRITQELKLTKDKI